MNSHTDLLIGLQGILVSQEAIPACLCHSGKPSSLVFEPGHLYLTQVMVIMNMDLQYFWQNLLLQSWLVRDID